MGFDAVAIQGDWPDADRVNRFVHGFGGDDEAREALLAAAVAACRAAGDRYLLAELADEPPLRPMILDLRRAGFREAARVADLVRDGTDLVMLSIAP
ncbi:MAG TPA: erythromycin esterase family protein [Gemmatimonadaceae bacterium]